MTYSASAMEWPNWYTCKHETHSEIRCVSGGPRMQERSGYHTIDPTDVEDPNVGMFLIES